MDQDEFDQWQEAEVVPAVAQPSASISQLDHASYNNENEVTYQKSQIEHKVHQGQQDHDRVEKADTKVDENYFEAKVDEKEQIQDFKDTKNEFQSEPVMDFTQNNGQDVSSPKTEEIEHQVAEDIQINNQQANRGSSLNIEGLSSVEHQSKNVNQQPQKLQHELQNNVFKAEQHPKQELIEDQMEWVEPSPQIQIESPVLAQPNLMQNQHHVLDEQIQNKDGQAKNISQNLNDKHKQEGQKDDEDEQFGEFGGYEEVKQIKAQIEVPSIPLVNYEKADEFISRLPDYSFVRFCYFQQS